MQFFLFFWSVATFIQFLFMSALALAFKKATSMKWHFRDSRNDPQHYGQQFNHNMSTDESLYEWCSAKACTVQKSPQGRDEYYVYMDKWNKKKAVKLKLRNLRVLSANASYCCCYCAPSSLSDWRHSSVLIRQLASLLLSWAWHPCFPFDSSSELPQLCWQDW